MKIAKVYSLMRRGPYATSEHWQATRQQIRDAIRECEWPVGSGCFTIPPEGDQGSGESEGVKPIRDRFVRSLQARGRAIEGRAKKALDERLGDLDLVLKGPVMPIAVEWETGDISSPHRSINLLALLLKAQAISAGVLVVPSRRLCLHLPDRIGYIDEMMPYFAFWRSVRCREGVLEIVVIEQDAENRSRPRTPAVADGTALA